MNHPALNPALVTEKAVKRLPRWALLLLCAAYVLPGVFGRDPWKNADIAAFGQMWSLALGQASWWAPHVGGVPPTAGGVLPYWLGGAFISALNPWIDPALAARLPFAGLLAAVLALTWYTTYHLARTEAAQPIPLAFGGEAPAPAYARALADGAVLALIASLGLLQLGHETTPEMLQLTGSALFLYGLAAAPAQPAKARWATVTSLLVLATSGSPAVALWLMAIGTVVGWRSHEPVMRQHVRWVLTGGALAALAATTLSLAGLSGWHYQLGMPKGAGTVARLLLWFTWPTLPLALWTLWSWRRQSLRRHIAVPMLSALLGIGVSVAMGGQDKALLHALPPLAVLAAFSLPTLKRGFTSAIDWFSVFFFSLAGGLIWLGYTAMHTGWPTRTAARFDALVPGQVPQFAWAPLLLAVAATVAWLAVVRWRTARHQTALWKSMVLPAGGVALGWLLLMTLWLPLLDQARSYRLVLDRLAPHLQADTCVLAPGASAGMLTALEYFASKQVDGRNRPLGSLHNANQELGCGLLVLPLSASQTTPTVPGWVFLARERQRTRNSETVAVYEAVR
jgi:4-amino-4-deoxy-L-arabinose transferase-like glycosyltransferase